MQLSLVLRDFEPWGHILSIQVCYVATVGALGYDAMFCPCALAPQPAFISVSTQEHA